MSFKRNEPVKNTCPTIDNIIVKTKSELQEIHSFVKDYDCENNIITSICYIESVLEDIEVVRDANTALRSWGNGLVEYIDKLEKEHQNELQAMQDKIDGLQWDLDNFNSGRP